MKKFCHFSSVTLGSFKSYSNTTELVNRKLDILHKTTDPNLDGDYLFVGFSPACLLIDRHFYIAEVEQDVVDFLTAKQAKFTRVDLDQVNDKSFDYTVALDEYYTFAESEQEQVSMIAQLSRVTKQRLITSLRDYKNQDFREKDFGTPIMIHNQQAKKIYLECHDHSPNCSQWHSLVYELLGDQCVLHGPYSRLPVYFKQLAKFSYDAGAQDFSVEKKLMYKGLIRKNFEHVISITY